MIPSKQIFMIIFWSSAETEQQMLYCMETFTKDLHASQSKTNDRSQGILAPEDFSVRATIKNLSCQATIKAQFQLNTQTNQRKVTFW